MQGRARAMPPNFEPHLPAPPWTRRRNRRLNRRDAVHRRVMSMHVREPVVQPVAVKSLRPTQITVGMREVDQKRKRWREHKGKKKAAFLGRHMIPVVRGPKDYLYVIDHHHLARALLDEGQTDVVVSVIADLRALDRAT